TGYAARSVTDGLDGVEPDASPSTVHRWQRRPRNFFAGLFIERVAFGKRDNRGILPRGAERALLHQGFRIAAREVSQVACLDRTIGRMNVSHRRRFGDAADFE